VFATAYVARSATRCIICERPERIANSASGPITISDITCPSGTESCFNCYSFTATLNQPKVSPMNGTLIVGSTGTSENANTVCYTIMNTSTESLGISSPSHCAGSLDFGPAQICVTTHTTKEATTYSEIVKPTVSWTNSGGGGRGKETWKVAPTTAGTLAGSGIVRMTGSATLGCFYTNPRP
jgi:hypothetical protein